MQRLHGLAPVRRLEATEGYESDQFGLMRAKLVIASHDRRREGHTTSRKDDKRD